MKTIQLRLEQKLKINEDIDLFPKNISLGWIN
jgi:hypothetical protein